MNKRLLLPGFLNEALSLAVISHYVSDAERITEGLHASSWFPPIEMGKKGIPLPRATSFQSASLILQMSTGHPASVRRSVVTVSGNSSEWTNASPHGAYFPMMSWPYRNKMRRCCGPPCPPPPQPQAKAAPQPAQVNNHFWEGHPAHPGIEAEYPHPKSTSNTHTHAHTRAHSIFKGQDGKYNE